MKRIILLLVLFKACFLPAQYTNTEVVAQIKTKTTHNQMISVMSTATNTTELNKSLRYVVTAFRTDTSNTITKNKQEDRFTLEANESKILSTAIANILEGEKLVVLLLIYEEDNIIGKDRVVFDKKTTNVSPEKDKEILDDGITLKGIVTEETKTKPGRDFYDFFYSSYVLNQIKGEKVVKISEKLSFGRSTIIQIKIEDIIIHQFIGKPDLEYLEQMSRIAIRKVYKYFQDLKNQKSYIFQY